jgi:hypothetical protein
VPARWGWGDHHARVIASLQLLYVAVAHLKEQEETNVAGQSVVHP